MYLVVSYPKSGATWFQFLMYFCFHDSFISSEDIVQFYPPIINRSLVNKNKQNRSVFFAKSHQLPHELNLKDKDIKGIIYLFRNPYDVLASKVNHHINEGSLRLKFKHYRERFINQELKAEEHNLKTSWTYHINSWLNLTYTNKICYVQYESLIQDPLIVLSRLNNELNFDITSEDINRSISNSSLRQMKKIEKEEITNKTKGLFYSPKRRLTAKFFKTSFINKGKVNSHKEVLSPVVQKKAHEIFDSSEKRLLAVYKS